MNRTQLPTLQCRALLLALLLIVPFLRGIGQAQTDSVCITATLNASGHIRVEQPEELTRRLMGPSPVQGAAEASEENRETSEEQVRGTRAGYRVQAFDDNNPRTSRGTAASLKSRIESTFPYRAYVSFNSPYWRVKVGDFRSRAEAESAMAEIRRAFPELKAYLRIVRDRINVYE